MGLLEDILGFVGESFRQQNEQRQKAFQTVQKTGKLPPGFTSSLVGGVISPGTWKSMEPEAKASMNLLADKFPGFFKRVMSDPRELYTMMKAPEEVGQSATGATFRSLADYKGMGGGGRIRLTPEVAGDVPVLSHEVQHYLNAPRIEEGIVGGDANEALANRIWKALPEGGRSSLDQRLGQLNMVRSGYVPPELKDLHAVAGPEMTSKILQSAALDEGLAHLTEHTARGTGGQGVSDLANELGVGAGEKGLSYQQPEGGLLNTILGLFKGGQ